MRVVRMQLRYGVTEAESWWHFALGPQREQIWTRLREIGTQIVGLFLFDKGAPDPVTDWPRFAASIEAVLKIGATPMITFARYHRPFDDLRGVRWFAERCGDVAWSCIDQWGGEVVRDWYWCVWNEPNSAWIGGGLSFEQYRRIYEAVAERVARWLAPHLDGRRALIGGPAIEGFLPTWLDWYWRFIHEIDNSLIGFVNWHRYGEWRDFGEEGAPRDDAAYRALIMSRTSDYEARARAVARLLGDSGILNICGEVNTHSHYDPRVRARFNQTIFGAAYYASALLHLIRGGADAELFWTGTDDAAGYGMLDPGGMPTPVFHAKRLCAQSLRYGDSVTFPADETGQRAVEIAVARGKDGRRSALLVHLSDEAATYDASDWSAGLSDCRTLLKVDRGTGNRVHAAAWDGRVAFDGYGVAAVMTEDVQDEAGQGHSENRQ